MKGYESGRKAWKAAPLMPRGEVRRARAAAKLH